MLKASKFIFSFILSLSFLCVFSSSLIHAQQHEENNKISIIASTFPIYDWLTQIIGDDESPFELELLVDTGVDFHSYEPTTSDIANVINADIFVYNGGDSDLWVLDILELEEAENVHSISMMNILEDNLLLEEIVEGMQEDAHNHVHHDEHAHHNNHEEEHVHDENCTHDNSEDDEHMHHDEMNHVESHIHMHGDEAVYDEHVWLSLTNAIIACEALSEIIQEVDPQNSEIYQENTQRYIDELRALHENYLHVLGEAKYDTLLFADRFPFRYLLNDYNLSYFAAFPGCSAETEASFETVAFLSDKINELQLGKILIIDNGSDRIAQSIIQNSDNTDAQIHALMSLQAISAEDIENGTSYISEMQRNLEILQIMLN